MRSMVLGLGLVVPLAMLAACNEVTTGDYGALTFTPDHCGANGCTLDDRLIVGATVNVTLDDAADPHSNVDLSNLTLITDAPGVVHVSVVEVTSFTSEWKVTGLASGDAHLIAIDENGYEVDRTEIHVGVIRGYRVIDGSEGAVRGADRTGYDQVWNIAKNGVGDFKLDVNDSDAMGYLQFHVDIDEALLAHTVFQGELTDGHLEFENLPTGEYDAIFSAPDGSSFAILIVQQ
jgi:hypothetical protein